MLAAALSSSLLLVSGCSWFGDDEPRATGPDPAAAQPGEAQVEVIGSVDPDDVEVGTPLEAPETGQGVYFVSELFPVSGPRLDQPVLVRVLLDNAVPEGTPVAVAARDDDDAPWRFLKGQLDAEGTHVEFIVPQLATFGVVAVDADSITSTVSASVDEALEADASRPEDVQKPTCTDPTGAAQDGYVAKSWRRATVGWCLDRTGEERVLRLTNLRGVPVRVDAPGADERGTTGDAARPEIAWDAWTTAVATGLVSDPAAGDSTATVIAPGQTLEVDADLDPGSSLLVTAGDDARNRSVRVLHAAAVALATQVADFGLAAKAALPDGEATLGELLAAPACAEALGGTPVQLARGCLGGRALTRAFGDQALLLAPALVPRPTGRMLATRLGDLEDQAPKLEQRLEVSRDLADFGVLVGRYTGTGRSLVVSPDGLVTESFGTAAGAVMTLGYQLSDPTLQGSAGSATATVTSVQVLDRRAAGGRVPQVGQAGIVSLGADGVLRAPFLGATYCNPTAATRGRCTDQPLPTAKPTPSVPRVPSATPSTATGTGTSTGSSTGSSTGTTAGAGVTKGAPAPTPGPGAAGR